MDAQTTKERYEEITSHLRNGGYIQVVTALRAIQYGPEHIGYFRVTNNGLYARHGKRWDCIDYCSMRFGRKA